MQQSDDKEKEKKKKEASLQDGGLVVLGKEVDLLLLLHQREESLIHANTRRLRKQETNTDSIARQIVERQMHGDVEDRLIEDR